ncbi:MAG: DNA internalization-related competence protein ComEC/Rec2 [Neisseriaceae bacterium]|nr:DNA internalization-related competence protein ComEC/Rec2 [Neisseriaceae bacterium]
MKFLPFFCLGVVASFAFPYDAAHAMALWILCLILSLLSYRYFPKMLWIMALLLGLFYGFDRTQNAISHRLSAENSGQFVDLSIRVISPPQKTDINTRFDALVLENSLPQKIHTIRLVDYQQREWTLGSQWKISARINAPIGMVNHAGFNTEAWALSNGLDAIGSVRKERFRLPEKHFVSIDFLREKIDQRISRAGQNYPRGAALVSALTVGMNHHLSQDDWTHFRHLGLTHVVSISGLHITMFALLVGMLALAYFRLAAKIEKLPMPNHPKKIILILGLCAALIYSLITGFSVPTQRSLLMLLIAGLAVIGKRYWTMWQIWFVALTVVLLYDPLSVLSIGFWLSFGLVGALLWFSGSLKNDHRPYAKLKMTLAAQVAVSVASVLPLSLFFHALPIISPVVNIIGVPWFSLVITPISLLALLLPFDWGLTFASCLAEYTLYGMDALQNLSFMIYTPQVSWVWIVLGLLATLILLSPRVLGMYSWALIVLSVLVLYQPFRLPENHLKATVYDVGQGLSVLLQTKHHQLLFDTGKKGAEMNLIPALHADGIFRLDALVLSHGDEDHDGAVKEIQQVFPIKQTWAGAVSDYDFPVNHCQAGKSWTWDGVYFEWLTPFNPSDDVESNDRSCVLHAVAGDYAILITGDLSHKGEIALIQQHQDDLYSQVLILGHHGSKTSSLPRFLATVLPTHAVVSAGFSNSFSHPAPTIVRWLNEHQIQIWRTDQQGMLSFELGKQLNAQKGIRYQPYWQQKPLKP